MSTNNGKNAKHYSGLESVSILNKCVNYFNILNNSILNKTLYDWVDNKTKPFGVNSLRFVFNYCRNLMYVKFRPQCLANMREPKTLAKFKSTQGNLTNTLRMMTAH